MDRRIRLWVNGRFLGRPVTGVERVAENVLKALDAWRDVLASGCTFDGLNIDVRIAIPASLRKQIGDFWHGWPVEVVGTHEGHAWEQWDLASLPSRDWVLSLCNTGPMFRRNHAVMMHDAQVFALPKNFNWKFRWWYRLLFGVMVRHARVVMTNSDFSRRELARYLRVSPQVLHVMHLGADHIGGIAAPLPMEIEQRLPSRPFVLAVSSVNANKNYKAILQALSLMGEDAPACVTVGQRVDHVFKAGVSLDDRVIHLGRIDDASLVRLYRQALCLVYPSFYEGFGLPPIEAMRCGCPVIVSNTSSLPEVCGQAARYCDPHDPASIAVEIRRLLDSPISAYKQRQGARLHASAYVWKKSARSLLNQIARACSVPRPSELPLKKVEPHEDRRCA